MTDRLPDFSEHHTLTAAYFMLPRDYFARDSAVRWFDQQAGLNFGSAEKNVRVRFVYAESNSRARFVSGEQIAEFLAGFASQRPLVPFAQIAHWILRLVVPYGAGTPFGRLCDAFDASGKNWRNAGTFAGMMSAGLPATACEVAAEAACVRLRDRSFPLCWFTGMLNVSATGEVPAASPAEFDAHLVEALSTLTDDDVMAWLKTGRGKVSGSALAMLAPPRTWTERVDDLLVRPRLAGVRRHVEQMVAALAVPPRRRDPQRMPVGGYADVVTHGSVDRLLPSQHALDEIDFLRRFSENELLFFRREEPPTQARDALAIVLDQGVRTWGDVRLVLTAATLALAQRAVDKAKPMQFACTSRSHVASLTDLSDPELAATLEASDVTRHPGEALERILETKSDVPRDVYLLTHPFALNDDNVRAAARRLGKEDRLFALTVTGRGEAALVELRHGLPVLLRSFRIDFAPATTAAAKTPSVEPTDWKGPVERVGWPFPFCPRGPAKHIAFDEAGKHVLTVLERGMLCVWNIASARAEVLPRPRVGGIIITNWRSVVGVEGGFALLAFQETAAHVFLYRLDRRECTYYTFANTSAEEWAFGTLYYLRRLHSIVVARINEVADSRLIDLRTETVKAPNPTDAVAANGRSAWQYWESVNGRPLRVSVARATDASAVGKEEFRNWFISAQNGEVLIAADIEANGPKTEDGDQQNFKGPEREVAQLDVQRSERKLPVRWPAFVPHTDGRPTFVDRNVIGVQLAGVTLAIRSSPRLPNQTGDALTLFLGPDGHFLREIPIRRPDWQFLVSNDGRYVALAPSPNRFEVQDTATGARALDKPLGVSARNLSLWVGDHAFVLRCGRHGNVWHLADWSGPFVVRSAALSQLGRPDEAKPGVGADLLEDRDRCRAGAERGGIRFVLDPYGHVLAFDAKGDLIFQFFAIGDSWSAWIPSGQRCGRGFVHDRSNRSDAAIAIGRALREAQRRNA